MSVIALHTAEADIIYQLCMATRISRAAALLNMVEAKRCNIIENAPIYITKFMKDAITASIFLKAFAYTRLAKYPYVF